MNRPNYTDRAVDRTKERIQAAREMPQDMLWQHLCDVIAQSEWRKAAARYRLDRIAELEIELAAWKERAIKEQTKN